MAGSLQDEQNAPPVVAVVRGEVPERREDALLESPALWFAFEDCSQENLHRYPRVSQSLDELLSRIHGLSPVGLREHSRGPTASTSAQRIEFDQHSVEGQ